jgi:hypothetical protein
LVVVEGLLRKETDAGRSGENTEPALCRTRQLAEGRRLPLRLRIGGADRGFDSMFGRRKLTKRASETGNDRLSVRTRNEAN